MLPTKPKGALVPKPPAAPPAPSLRNAQGQSPAKSGSTAALSSANTPTTYASSGGITPTGVPGANKPIRPPRVAPAAKPVKASYVAPTTGFVTDDPMYWNNVMALGEEYKVRTAGAITDQTLADTAYFGERERMATDRGRSKRNLAESLAGRGSAIYSGRHFRDQTEAATDFVNNSARLDSDYATKNAFRAADRADIEAQLAPGTGSKYLIEQQAAQDRKDAAELLKAENGELPGDTPKKGNGAAARKRLATRRERERTQKGNLTQQIKADNKRINKLRTRAAEIEDEEQRKALRQRIHKVRRRRDKLKNRRDKMKAER